MYIGRFYLLPRRLQSPRFKDPFHYLFVLHLCLRDFPIARDCRVMCSPLGWKPDASCASPSGFLASATIITLCRLSFAATLAFRPRPPTPQSRLLGCPGFGSDPGSDVLTVASGGFSVEDRSSFFPLSWSSGFYPRLCYQASSALTLQYSSRICHPLYPSPLRVRLRGSVL